MHAGDPHFLGVDAPAGPAVPSLVNSAGLHVSGVRAVAGFGEPEGDAALSGELALDELEFLVVGVVVQHVHDREIADDECSF
jgi:hypothetical protein